MASPDPDSDVLALVAAGRRAAAARILLARHGAEIRRRCHRALRDPALAEDVAQQVFLHADRDLPRFTGQSTVRTWLFAIARHRMLDAARSRRRARARLVCATPRDFERGDGQPLADARLDDARLGHTLHAAICGLDPGLQEVIRLHYEHGLSFTKIARDRGERPGTLATRVMRALPTLRAFIEARLGASPA